MSLIAQKLISASGATEETDDSFNLVTSLYHFDGSNGAQNNTLLDSSPESHTVTRNADIVQGSFSPFSSEEGKWSASFDGTDDYLGVLSSSDFALGSGDFTLEAFVFQNNEAGSGNTSHNIINKWNNTGNLKSYFLRITESSGQKLQFFWSTDGNSNNYITSNDSLNVGQWHHVAVVNNGGTLTLFIDGTAQSSTGTAGTLYTSSAQIQIGRTAADSGSQYFDGFISNVRIVKGTAIYTSSSYTVPTAPLTAVTNTKLLTCCSNRFRDKSTSAHRVAPNDSGVNHMTSTILPKVQPFSPFAPSSSYSAASKGGSGFFDQTSDCYFDVSDATDFDFGTGDYTVEMWVYPTTTFLVNWAMAFNTIGVNQYWAWTDGGGNSAAAGLSSYPSGNYSGSFDHMPNRFSWSHIVFQNTSGTENWYINGVRVYNATNNPSFSASATGVRVGLSPAYASQFFYGGYISDVRVLKGSNAYSNASTLTVPTAPLGSVTNTKLLTNFTNAAIFDQTGKTNVDTVGNAQLDTSVKKFGTASAEFDGTGDRLVLSNYHLAPVGTQSFTVECFAYVTDVSNYRCIYSAGYGIQIYIWTDSKVSLYIGNASGSYDVNGFQSTSTISTNTWTHIAVVRDSSNSTLTIFINGTASGQTSVTTDIPKLTGASDYSHVIGSYSNGNYSFSGYIDEFRLTHKARYTSNFTAPSKEFPNL